MAFFRCNSVAAMRGAEATPDYERRGLWWERPFVLAAAPKPLRLVGLEVGGAVGEQRK